MILVGWLELGGWSSRSCQYGVLTPTGLHGALCRRGNVARLPSTRAKCPAPSSWLADGFLSDPDLGKQPSSKLLVGW